MNIDEIDIKILREMFILNGNPVTTTSLAKRIFGYNERREIQKADQIIRQRLEKLLKYELIEKMEENGKKNYFLRRGNLFLGVQRKNQIIWVKI